MIPMIMDHLFHNTSTRKTSKKNLHANYTNQPRQTLTEPDFLRGNRSRVKLQRPKPNRIADPFRKNNSPLGNRDHRSILIF